MLNLTLSINKDKVEKCLGKSTRDAIDDVCEIIGRWQKRVVDRYDEKFRSSYSEFHYLLFDVKDRVKKGDNRMKDNLKTVDNLQKKSK